MKVEKGGGPIFAPERPADCDSGRRTARTGTAPMNACEAGNRLPGASIGLNGLRATARFRVRPVGEAATPRNAKGPQTAGAPPASCKRNNLERTPVYGVSGNGLLRLGKKDSCTRTERSRAAVTAPTWSCWTAPTTRDRTTPRPSHFPAAPCRTAPHTPDSATHVTAPGLETCLRRQRAGTGVRLPKTRCGLPVLGYTRQVREVKGKSA